MTAFSPRGDEGAGQDQGAAEDLLRGMATVADVLQGVSGAEPSRQGTQATSIQGDHAHLHLRDYTALLEPAGALEFINEFSGFAVAPAPISLSQNSGMHVPTPNVARQEVTHGYH